MKLISFLLIGVFLFAKINLNFENLDIHDFIKMVAKITNKNILITQDIRGKVNFISVKPLTKEEVYQVLLNILTSKGYTIVEDNGFLKVVRSADAIKNAPPLFKSDIYQMRTDIIPLYNISASDAYVQINYLKSRYGKIVVNKDKNLLIITDYPKNLKIIKQLLKQIDTKNEKQIAFFKFKYIGIEEGYSKVSSIIETMYSQKIYKYKLIKNNYNNTLIAVAPKKIIQSIKEIINQLDVPAKSLGINTEIVRLKNSDVDYMQKVLTKIIDQKYTKNKPSITSDKETNSLIIVGNTQQIQTLKTIIDALDIQKSQVYVKARILEISNLKASQIGLRYGLVGGISSSSGLYTMSANLGGPALAFDPTTLGLSAPTVQKGLALGATLDLLETLGAAKKLSEPSILCINNTSSTIYVGKTISVLTGKTTSTSTSESYTRQDIGLTLKITPRIDSDNKVALNVDAIIEDLLPGSQVGLPTTSKRTINTTTIVKNGQSIIIGGLVRNNSDITINKIPLLGDIPFLGALFRNKQVSKDQTTLAIVLTPYIVKKSEDLDKLRETLAKLDLLEKKFVEKIKSVKVIKNVKIK